MHSVELVVLRLLAESEGGQEDLDIAKSAVFHSYEATAYAVRKIRFLIRDCELRLGLDTRTVGARTEPRLKPTRRAGRRPSRMSETFHGG